MDSILDEVSFQPVYMMPSYITYSNTEVKKLNSVNKLRSVLLCALHFKECLQD